MPRAVSLRISAPLERAALPALFERTCALLEAKDAQILRCEVAGLSADAVAVDALSRLALAARRRGCGVRVDTGTELSRGRTYVDRWNSAGWEANCQVAVDIDAGRFLELLIERIGGLGRPSVGSPR